MRVRLARSLTAAAVRLLALTVSLNFALLFPLTSARPVPFRLIVSDRLPRFFLVFICPTTVLPTLSVAFRLVRLRATIRELLRPELSTEPMVCPREILSLRAASGLTV